MYDPMGRTYEDMAALKYKVELNESERTHLKQMASRGETSARKVKRALLIGVNYCCRCASIIFAA